ncbi:MAG TPA: hypothetical protein VN448_05110, partial [Gammaproteobacteria bacterium]|nr:hypothetical protein [Gammaproteobacteria bacterium]
MPKPSYRPMTQRRNRELPEGNERRSRPDRRNLAEHEVQSRTPSWSEQVVQFLTRYLFVVLGIMFFNFTTGISPAWMTPLQLNIAFAAYFVINSALFWHASRRPLLARRFRIAMWVDIVITSISVLNDPYAIP